MYSDLASASAPVPSAPPADDAAQPVYHAHTPHAPVVYPALPAAVPPQYFLQYPPSAPSFAPVPATSQYALWGVATSQGIVDPPPPAPPPPAPLEPKALAAAVRANVPAAELAHNDCRGVPAEAWADRTNPGPDMAALGVRWADLVRAGATRLHVRRIGAAVLARHTGMTIDTLAPLLDANHAIDQLRVAAPTCDDLYEIGASVFKMRTLGLTRMHIKAFGLSGEEWALLGMTSQQIRELDVTSADAAANGWTRDVLTRHMHVDEATLSRLGRAFRF